jgi:hypothetical protein
MTQSLLSSWNYLWADFDKYEDKADEYRQKAYDDFLAVLNREPRPTSDAMQKGIDFEAMVMDICADKLSVGHKWFEAAAEIAKDVKGGQFQAVAQKTVNVNGTDLLLYGRIDCLKAGTIIDIKYTGKYSVGKFYNSPQHPMYMELIPESNSFVYMVSNGRSVWRETYLRDEYRPITITIQEFFDYLKTVGLYETYLNKWVSK